MIPDLKESTIDELNRFEGDPSLILTENPQGLWKKMEFDPKEDPNENTSFLAVEDKKIVNKKVPFDYAYGWLSSELPFPHSSGEVDWVVKWQSVTPGNYGLIKANASTTFTLQPGYKYKLTAWLTGTIGGSNYWEIHYQWYNNTTKGWVGIPAINRLNISEASSSFNPAIAWVIMSGPGSTKPEDLVLKITWVNPAGIPSNISSGSKFMIEAMP
jgi:hypothetical protein